MSKKKVPKVSYAGLPRTERAKLVGRLGGLARAAKLSPEERSRISAKGGMVTYLRYGSEHYSKLGSESWNSTSESEKVSKMETMRARKKQADLKKKSESDTIPAPLPARKPPTKNAR